MTLLRSCILAAALAGAVTLAATCGGEPATPAPAPDVALVVDGLEIRTTEFEPYVAFVQSYAPEWGRKTIARHLIGDYVLPLRLAQRAFAEQRRPLREQAEALRQVATNVLELEQRSTLFVQQRKDVTRRQVEPPIAQFAFDPLATGSVSPVFEVPRGFVIAGCYQIRESAALVDDLADLLQVGFVTHTNTEWTEWLRAEQERIRSKVTYVHPDYRDALPPWLQHP